MLGRKIKGKELEVNQREVRFDPPSSPSGSWDIWLLGPLLVRDGMV